MDSTLAISRSLLDEIARVSAASEAEICGLLMCPREAHRRVTVVHCRNVHPEPTRNFEIDPVALIAAYRAQRSGGPAILGCYHSHPSGDARPSRHDAAAADPNGWVWLIATSRDITAWRAVRDGAVHGRFDPLTLIATPPCA